MSVLVPALLAAAAVAVLLGLPAPYRRPPPARPAAGEPPVGPGTAWGAAGARAAPAAALVAGLLLAGPPAALVLAVLAVAARRAAAARVAARERRAEQAGAQEALSVLAGELRAGRSPGDALQAAATVATGPFARAVSSAARATRLGADPVLALREGAASGAVPEVLTGLAACWQVCGSTGSSLAAAVERLSDALRSQHAVRLAVEAELAGPRATAGLLAVLPLAGIALAAGLGARPLHVLLHSAVGSACLLLGVGLDLLGLWWTGRLVAAAGGR